MEEICSQNFFTTFEKKCEYCKNWKIHQVLSSLSTFEQNSHLTCICDLFKYGTVCCPQGFKLLLEKKTELVTKVKSSPMISTLSMLLCQQSSISEENGEIFLECREILKVANDKYDKYLYSKLEKICLDISPKK